jgi:Xaa-Pro aminopeptidase
MNNPIYKSRREALMQLLDERSVAVMLRAHYKVRSNDTEFPYRQESNFYYLSGINEDHCAIVLDGAEKKSYLFVKEITEEETLWLGSRMGISGAKALDAFDEVYDIDTFEAQMKTLFQERVRLYYDLFGDDPLLETLRLTCKELLHARGVLRSPRCFADVFELTQKMRLIKSDDEVLQIRQALAITKEAHHRAMRLCRDGMKEYEIEVEIEYIFAKNGASHNAYASIVAGGNNANILHYVDNKETLQSTDLLLIDAGCEYGMYASDITRTFPVSGRFTQAQRELYEMLLHVQLEIIAMICPGISKKIVQEASERLLCEGMVRLGILKGEVDTLLEAKTHKKYYPHGIGHWLGLDVHDPSPYVDEAGEQIVFEAGMVMTIEPGIYIKSNDKDAPQRFRGMGIRIEDNILVTAQGCENLSEEIVKTVDAIEAMCQSSL